MRKVRSRSTAIMCAFLAFLVLIFQALLLYEKTHAFSPSLAASAKGAPLCSKQNSDILSLKSVAKVADFDGQNQTFESAPIRYDPSLVRFRCRIAYDGTNFAGFQTQHRREESSVSASKSSSNSDLSDSSSIMKKRKRNNDEKRTVQGELEKVLSQRFQRVVKAVGAGRTDTGVHARGQAIHFDLYHNETKKKSSTESSFERDLEVAMNSMLPSDICVWNLGHVSPTVEADNGSNSLPPGWYNWNSMRSCSGKLYSYRICTGNTMNPFERYNRWQLVPWPGVDLERLEMILKHFEGEHDFVCFAGRLDQTQKKTGIALDTVRTIHKIQLVEEPNANTTGCDMSHHYYRIDIFLDGALYKMVRNIVGTAIAASRGVFDEETLLDLLNRPSELKLTRKSNPCKSAPANGLTLERVFYPDDTEF